jgi:dTDP-L-rhamnose 4-epimerase
VVNATILGLEKEEANYQSFNVGTGIQTSVMEVAEELMSNYNKEVPIHITGQFRKGDIRHNVADMQKTENLLGFQAKISFKEGMKNFTDWVEKQTIMSDQYESSLDELRSKGLLK